MIRIHRIDHLVLTVRDVQASLDFYTRVLGLMEVTFGDGRKALVFGEQKINLHPAAENPALPIADAPAPGTADFCLITDTPLAEVTAHLDAQAVPVITGPVRRTGAVGPIESVYIRDPDGNLVEIANYV